MAVAADVLTAGAASVAALLSGVNLYVSGRREEQRWNREALIEAFVTFVGASFFLQRGLYGWRTRRAKRSGEPQVCPSGH
jgi:hypothetical protein